MPVGLFVWMLVRLDLQIGLLIGCAFAAFILLLLPDEQRLVTLSLQHDDPMQFSTAFRDRMLDFGYSVTSLAPGYDRFLPNDYLPVRAGPLRLPPPAWAIVYLDMRDGKVQLRATKLAFRILRRHLFPLRSLTEGL
jgi:hypothetical protein